MKINWKVRFRNPWFWVLIFSTIVSTVFATLGMNIQDITTWKILGEVILSVLKNPFMIFSIVVNVIAVTVDPTTKGLGDSQRALTYQKPNK